MTIPRILAIMGSGETAPTMTKVHRTLFERMGPGAVPAVMLDTPFGFQANADELTERTTAYFKESVDRAMGVASLRRASEADALGLERVRLQIREARLVFAGPGSPSYALRQWAGGPVPTELADKLRSGGCVTFSSAAALTLGVATVPVYEVYKVGADPEWLPGLNLTAATGLSFAVVPHYDNAEGGTHDTRFCYLGEGRLRALEGDLEPETFVLGVDEHTAAIFDLGAGTMEVLGRGGVTVRAEGRSEVIATGATVTIGRLGEIAGALREGRAATPDAVAPLPASAAPTSDARGGSPSLLESVNRLEAEFDVALSSRDAVGAVRVALSLEAALHEWAADTLQSDEADRGRAVLRGMIVRLGDAAEGGVRDPKEVLGPWVEALLALRAGARADKRWSDADVVRDQLIALGVEVRDGAGGTEWDLRPAGVPSDMPTR
ncbi:MAG: hypothetical protein NVSMB4_08120 [Acidimicrobiales bacterium]